MSILLLPCDILSLIVIENPRKLYFTCRLFRNLIKTLWSKITPELELVPKWQWNYWISLYMGVKLKRYSFIYNEVTAFSDRGFISTNGDLTIYNCQVVTNFINCRRIVKRFQMCPEYSMRRIFKIPSKVWAVFILYLDGILEFVTFANFTNITRKIFRADIVDFCTTREFTKYITLTDSNIIFYGRSNDLLTYSETKRIKLNFPLFSFQMYRSELLVLSTEGILYILSDYNICELRAFKRGIILNCDFNDYNYYVSCLNHRLTVAKFTIFNRTIKYEGYVLDLFAYQKKSHRLY